MDENNKKKRTKEDWEKAMSNFTDDLWIEIFRRLPINSLLRFKSVSKSWLSIISSDYFAKSHLETAPKDDEIFIVHHGFDNDDEQHEDYFSLLHLDSGCFFENLKFPYLQGEYPFDLIPSLLVGSDCGIVCVCIKLTKCAADANNKFGIYLWNPATRHSKLLPPYTIIPDNDRIKATLGFGFDHIDSDFKVVRLVSSAVSISAEVYSSNGNGWRKIKSKPINHFHYDKSFDVCSFDVCFHGFLFVNGKNNCMGAFNLNKEFFIWDINLPADSFDDATRYITTRVTVFKDTIAVIISNMDKGRIQLWTLDDEACLCDGGVNALWTKVLTVDVGVALDFVAHFFNNVQFSLIDTDDNRFLYDLNKKLTKNFPESLYLESLYLEPYEIFKYTKSLFSLKGFEQIKWAA